MLFKSEQWYQHKTYVNHGEEVPQSSLHKSTLCAWKQLQSLSMSAKWCIEGVPPTHITAQGCTAVENKVRKNVTLESQNITQMRLKIWWLWGIYKVKHGESINRYLIKECTCLVIIIIAPFWRSNLVTVVQKNLQDCVLNVTSTGLRKMVWYMFLCHSY